MENRCGKCGFGKSEHSSCEAVLKDGKKCKEFLEFKHATNCPISGCFGDCEATIICLRERIAEEKKRCQPHLLS